MVIEKIVMLTRWNCSLAYVEMRTILARVLYNFDLTMSPQSDGWTSQKNFNLWERAPLLVHLMPRKM